MQGTNPTAGRRDTIAEVAAACLLAGAMIFGGGSRGAGDAVVHLLAVPALWLAVTRWRHADASRPARLLLYWLLAAALLLGLQLLPIPASLFARLPQRASVLADLHRGGLQPAWLPMTLNVMGTVRAALALATFAAMALLAMTLSADARRRLWMLALCIAVPMALLGFAQAAAGDAPTLRFYDYHHPMGAIGLFANRNHFADLMAMLLPFALAFAAGAVTRQQRPRAAAWYALAVALLLAAALSFSRAGIALTALALAASAMLIRPSGARGRHALPLLATGIAALAVATYAWDGIVARLAQDPLVDLRWQYLRIGRDVLHAWWPLGSGFGSFRDVYAPLEPVTDMVQVFALHAHNDLLEVLIEAGAPALALFAVFIALFAERFSKIGKFRQTNAADSRTLHVAALVACVIPVVHSLVDYPLRTLAIATLFALGLAQLCADPAPSISSHRRTA